MKHCASRNCPTWRWRGRHPEYIDSEESCDNCGTDLTPGSAPAYAPATPPEVRCPSCESAMRLEERSAVTIDRCDTCQHIWFDGFELDRVLKTERKLSELFALYQIPFRTATSQSAMRCPRCDKYSLIHGWVGGVLAHRCHICRGFHIEGSAIAKVGMTGTSAFARSAYREAQVVVDTVTTPESFGEMILEFLRNLLAES